MRRIKVRLSEDLEAAFTGMQLHDKVNIIRDMVGRTTSISIATNEYFGKPPSEYDQFDKALECGRDYLVGSTWSIAAFRRHYRSMPTYWQRLACTLAWIHVDTQVNVEIKFPKLIYDIRRRGQYVEIGLPHQDHGGEKHWITQEPFRTKYLVNVD